MRELFASTSLSISSRMSTVGSILSSHHERLLRLIFGRKGVFSPSSDQLSTCSGSQVYLFHAGHLDDTSTTGISSLTREEAHLLRPEDALSPARTTVVLVPHERRMRLQSCVSNHVFSFLLVTLLWHPTLVHRDVSLLDGALCPPWTQKPEKKLSVWIGPRGSTCRNATGPIDGDAAEDLGGSSIREAKISMGGERHRWWAQLRGRTTDEGGSCRTKDVEERVELHTRASHVITSNRGEAKTKVDTKRRSASWTCLGGRKTTDSQGTWWERCVRGKVGETGQEECWPKRAKRHKS